MGRSMLNSFFIIFCVFLSFLLIFPNTDIFSEDDGFFGIFPQDYYDPSEYGEEQTKSENLEGNNTNSNQIPLGDKYGKTPQNHLTNIETEDINFIAAGDWICNKETEKTIDRITEFQPELVLGLGDYTFEEITPQCWFDISEPINDKIKIAIGNHDLDYQSSYYQLLDHYNLKEPYYSFNFKNIHFLAISSEHPFEDESKQYNFIKQDLEQSVNDPSILWRIVFLHKPMYTSANFDENEAEELKNTFHELFEKSKVDLVLSGHTQYYQRSLPLSYNHDNPIYPVVLNNNNNEYSNNNGIIFITAGTAGDKLQDIENLLPYYVLQEKRYGFLNFEITNNGQTLVGTFHDTDDTEILDKFTISKDSNGKKKISDESYNAYNHKFYYTSEKDKTGLSNKNELFLTTNSDDHAQTIPRN
jgi:Calcineurin-like phosphoesterase